MARKSKSAFKMVGYTYPGTSPMTKKAETESEDFSEDDLLPVEGTKRQVRKASKKAKKAAKKFAKGK